MPEPGESIAVLLPFRDVEAWLDAAIASVRAAACVERIVLVDDGSRDASRAIAARHAGLDARIELLETSGIGIVGALSLARRRTTARYLARMDGDDVSLAGRIEACCRLLDAAPRLAAVGTRVQLVGEGVQEGMRRYVAWQNAITTADAHHEALLVESPLCHPSVVLRASALDAVGGYRDGPFPEDYDLWCRLDRAGYELAKTDTVGLAWRHRPGRLTFADERYSLARQRALKAEHLAYRLARAPRAERFGFAVWGAGPTGTRLARELERHGLRPRAFLDIDPNKIGRIRRGVRVAAPALLRDEPRPFVVVAVGARGARALIEAELVSRGLTSGLDYVCAA